MFTCLLVDGVKFLIISLNGGDTVTLMLCIISQNPTVDGTGSTTNNFLTESNKTTTWSHKTLILVPTAPLRVDKQSIPDEECILVNK